MSRDILIYGTKSTQNPGKHGPGPFALAIFFSKILAKYFLRYRDFGDFLVLDYNEPFVWAPRIIFCVIYGPPARPRQCPAVVPNDLRWCGNTLVVYFLCFRPFCVWFYPSFIVKNAHFGNFVAIFRRGPTYWDHKSKF